MFSHNGTNWPKSITLLQVADKIQSETADFAPGVAIWRTGRNTHVVINSGLFPSLHYMKEDVIHKTRRYIISHNRIAKDCATATCNMYRKFGEI